MKMILIVFIVYILNSPVWAHPGPVDAQGCHINSDSGRKHCHEVKKTKKSEHKLVKKKKKARKKKKS